MNSIIIYSLILLFLYLIIQHFLITQEGLENNCVTSLDGNSRKGCKIVATQRNSQAALFTKKKLKNAKKSILKLINEVSKLVQTKKVEVDKNLKKIKTNLTNVNKMKDSTINISDIENKRFVDEKYIDIAKTVKYEPNTFVVFMNSTKSIHGVEARELTLNLRRLCTFSASYKNQLFNMYDRKED